LYLLIVGLVLARLLLRPVEASRLIPAYWVFMGAGMITVLAAARLRSLPHVLVSRSFLADTSMVLWLFCTWLIPLILALGVWRHLLRRVSLAYETGLWSLVFPVAMYGLASHETGRAIGIRWMTVLGASESWVAAAVWAVVFVAMLGSLAQGTGAAHR
jgi:tellurite resistance protein TehA-like permease